MAFVKAVLGLKIFLCLASNERCMALDVRVPLLFRCPLESQYEGNTLELSKEKPSDYNDIYDGAGYDTNGAACYYQNYR